MKMSENTYKEVKELILETIKQKGIVLSEIKTKMSTNGNSEKNNETRLAWDLLWLSKPSPELMHKINYIEDLNDSHIDTALKRIVKSIA